MTQATSFICSLDDFLLHRQGQGEDFGGHALQEHRPNGLIQGSSRNTLTGSIPLGNASALEQIIWDDTLSPTLVIAHRHPFDAAAAEDQTLQECRSLPWWGKTFGSIGLTIQSKLCLISLKVFPTNIPNMSLLHKGHPVSTGNILNVELAISR